MMDEVSGLLAELGSGEDERAEAAVTKLAAYGPAALDALQSALAAPEADTRWWALRAVAEIDSPQAVSILLAGLGDAEPGVRQCAALGLRAVAERGPLPPEAIPPLAGLLNDQDHLCADMAGDTLVVSGKPAVPALLDALASAPQAARLRAVRALALIGDHRAIPALMAALKEDSTIMEYWANEGLDRLGFGMQFFEP